MLIILVRIVNPDDNRQIKRRAPSVARRKRQRKTCQLPIFERPNRSKRRWEKTMILTDTGQNHTAGLHHLRRYGKRSLQLLMRLDRAWSQMAIPSRFTRARLLRGAFGHAHRPSVPMQHQAGER